MTRAMDIANSILKPIYDEQEKEANKVNLNYFYVVDPDRRPLEERYSQAELDMYADLRRKIDEEVELIFQRTRHSWLYFSNDRAEIERICNGIDMGARPARSTMDNWRYSCITDNARSSMGLGEY